jgi:hypothetical protein
MPTTFYGLPLHPLVVHATVVIIPLAALTVVLAAVSSRFRGWAGPLPAGLSLVGVILVPMSTSTGETLEEHVANTAALHRHTEMAEGLLPWMIGLFVLAVVAYVLQRRAAADRGPAKAVTVAVSFLAIAAAIGTGVQVARIGHSGAKAAWNDTNMSSMPLTQE